jgi:hypothetical protein
MSKNNIPPRPGQGSSANGVTLEHLYELTGEQAVFLVVPYGEKGPREKGWGKITLEETRTESYRQKLREALRRGGNIGVLLGPPSGNLCAIDIDDDAWVERFLELNPKLKTTLRTRGIKGCQLWVRIISPYSKRLVHSKLKIPGTDKPVAEWRSSGDKAFQSILYGRHPDRVRYQFIVEAIGVEIAFSEINWPPEWGMDFTESESAPATNTPTGELPPDQEITPELRDRVMRYVETVEVAISGQGGSNPTYRLANVLVWGFALSREQALFFMRIYSRRCVPRWSEKELEHKVDDALKANHDKPRGYLLDKEDVSVLAELAGFESTPEGFEENKTQSSECAYVENVEVIEFSTIERSRKFNYFDKFD